MFTKKKHYKQFEKLDVEKINDLSLIDKEIRKPIEYLNSIKGVKTLYCCAGHEPVVALEWYIMSVVRKDGLTTFLDFFKRVEQAYFKAVRDNEMDATPRLEIDYGPNLSDGGYVRRFTIRVSFVNNNDRKEFVKQLDETFI